MGNVSVNIEIILKYFFIADVAILAHLSMFKTLLWSVETLQETLEITRVFFSGENSEKQEFKKKSISLLFWSNSWRNHLGFHFSYCTNRKMGNVASKADSGVKSTSQNMIHTLPSKSSQYQSLQCSSHVLCWIWKRFCWYCAFKAVISPTQHYTLLF